MQAPLRIQPQNQPPHFRELLPRTCVRWRNDAWAEGGSEARVYPRGPAIAACPSLGPDGSHAGAHMHPGSPQWGRWPCLHSYKSPLLSAHKSGPDSFSSRPFGLIEGSRLNFQMAQEVIGWGGAPPGKGVTTGLPQPSTKTLISAQRFVRSGQWKLRSLVGKEAKKTHVY